MKKLLKKIAAHRHENRVHAGKAAVRGFFRQVSVLEYCFAEAV